MITTPKEFASQIQKIHDTMGGFTLIEVMIVVLIIGVLAAVVIGAKGQKNEQQEFMEYCKSKGGTEQDCKWEWKRLKNGEKSRTMLFIPMYMGR